MNIGFLAIAWALTLTTATLLTTIGPLSAVQIGASDSLASFTVGIFLIGAALSSVPSGILFRRFGRFIGFTVGCTCQLVGSILGFLSLYNNDLTTLFFGCFILGLGQGLGQFYRFSAIELSPPELKSRAVTYVLSGGIIAAFLGPTAATYSAKILSTEYQGSFLAITLVIVLISSILKTSMYQ